MNKFKNSSCWSCEAKLMYSVKNVISKKGYEPGKRKYNQESVSKSTSTIAFPNTPDVADSLCETHIH